VDDGWYDQVARRLLAVTGKGSEPWVEA